MCFASWLGWGRGEVLLLPGGEVVLAGRWGRIAAGGCGGGGVVARGGGVVG